MASCLNVINAQNETKNVITVITEALERISLRAFGPHGRLQMIQTNPENEEITVTSHSSRLFPALHIENQIGRMLKALLSAHMNTIKDGGLFTMGLTCGLIRRGLRSSVALFILTYAYARVLHWACEALSESACVRRVDWRRSEELEALVRGVVGKCFGDDTESRDHVAKLTVEAFMRSLPSAKNLTKSRQFHPRVRVLPVCGREARASEWMCGVFVPGELFWFGSPPPTKDELCAFKNVRV
eukprot:363211_1